MSHHPRHAAPSRAAKIAGSVALTAIAAPAALLAVSGTASAAALPELPGLDGNRLALGVDGTSFAAAGETDLFDAALPALPAPDGLPGADVLGTNALTGADLAAVELLPGVTDLAGTDAFPTATDLLDVDVLPQLPEVEDGAGDDAPLGSLLDLDVLPTAADLPVAAQLDWQMGSEGSTTDLLPAGDVFSATDLLDGLV